jgi:hypothetical protein
VGAGVGAGFEATRPGRASYARRAAVATLVFVQRGGPGIDVASGPGVDVNVAGADSERTRVVARGGTQ